MSSANKVAAVYVTEKGRVLAENLKGLYPDLKIMRFRKDGFEKVWNEHRCFIFIMAAGIVVRTIASLVRDKKSDPAVVVLDESGKYAISLLSGHLGGANGRAREIADFLKGEAVITTSSDVNGLTSIDLWARDNDLVIEDWDLLPEICTRLVNKARLNVYVDADVTLPSDFFMVSEAPSADLIITNRKSLSSRGTGRPFALTLRPKNLVIGIGCNSQTSADEIEEAVKNVLDRNDLSFSSVLLIATIDLKKDEPGIKTFSERNSFEILSFHPEELNAVPGVKKSEAVFKATGANAVAEPSALLAARTDRLLVHKQKIGKVTVAVAEIKRRRVDDIKKGVRSPGKICVVGTGPGNIAHITPYALEAIRGSDVIVGYGTYIELIREIIKDKEVYSTGMTKEIERCGKAVELALGGKTVSVISGGDPGIYAMAGLVLELLRAEGRRSRMAEGDDRVSGLSAGRFAGINVEVIPGISAMNACAARLGAPLMHDFASISLSDRLTPWGLIERRLEAAASADFVIVLYNPKSKGRTDHISKARKIVLRHRLPGTPVGLVKGAMRKDESVVVTDLDRMLDHEIDMQTTVIIGNSKTFIWNGLMITPRGYEDKLCS